MTQLEHILDRLREEAEKMKPKEAHVYVNSQLDNLLKNQREQYWAHRDSATQLRMDVGFRLQRQRDARRSNILTVIGVGIAIPILTAGYFNAKAMTPNERRDMAQAISVFDDPRNKAITGIDSRAFNYKIAARDDLAAVEYNKIRQLYRDLQADCPQTETWPAKGCVDYYEKQISGMNHLPK